MDQRGLPGWPATVSSLNVVYLAAGFLAGKYLNRVG